jgi:hypothetical protein
MPLFNALFGKLAVFLLGILLFSIIVFLARRSRPTFNSDGDLVMRHSPFVLSLANIIGYGYPIIGAIVFLIRPPRGDEWIPALIFLPSGLVLAEMLFFAIIFHRIIVNSEGIRIESAFRKAFVCRWCDIVEVNYRSRMHPFQFFLENGTIIFVPSWMTGMSLLIEIFKAQLDPAIYTGSLEFERITNLNLWA